MATVETRPMSADEFWEFVRLPENSGKRFELEDGEVIEMPSPSEIHGVLCFLIAHILGSYLFQRGSGYLCTNDSGLIVRTDPDTVRGPDLMLFDESRPLEQMSRSFARGVPRLVVEVMSPSDRFGRVLKRVQQYLRRGVPLVWVVDGEDRIVTIYRPGQEQQPLDETEDLACDDILPGFRCKVADLFVTPGQ